MWLPCQWPFHHCILLMYSAFSPLLKNFTKGSPQTPSVSIMHAGDNSIQTKSLMVLFFIRTKDVSLTCQYFLTSITSIILTHNHDLLHIYRSLTINLTACNTFFHIFDLSNMDHFHVWSSRSNSLQNLYSPNPSIYFVVFLYFYEWDGNYIDTYSIKLRNTQICISPCMGQMFDHFVVAATCEVGNILPTMLRRIKIVHWF